VTHDAKVHFGGSIVNFSSGSLTYLRCSINDIMTGELIGTCADTGHGGGGASVVLTVRVPFFTRV